jgi:hypothetical protein
MGSGAANSYYGTFIGTGSEVMVSTPFRPRHVSLSNVDGLTKLVWIDGMGSGEGEKTVTDGTISYITAGGVTTLASGFKLGTDADLNVSGELVYFAVFE